MENAIAYTVCTASHLGQARAMAHSLSRHNPSLRIIIGLVDKAGGRFDTNDFLPYEIIEVEQLGIAEFGSMKDRYTLAELSCALKSFYASYILDRYAPEQLLYLDTDIIVTASFGHYPDELFADASIVLSPHITQPFPDDGKRPQTNTILNVGLYNGGFFALKNDDNSRQFLGWWKKNMILYCYDNPAEGFFLGQNWLSLVPLFFRQVRIATNPGYNVAYWNMHERQLSIADDRFVVNEKYPLVFFHYSGYNYLEPQLISRHQDRFSLQHLAAYQKLFGLISGSLRENEHSHYLAFACVYARPKGWRKFLKR